MPEHYLILVATFHVLREETDVTVDILLEKDRAFRRLSELPEAANWSLEYEEPKLDPRKEVTVQLVNGRVYRLLEESFECLAGRRLDAIRTLVFEATKRYPAEINNVIIAFADWMRERQIVRVIAAGRANLAASLPANRLAQGGAAVSIVGDRVPLPNTTMGGNVLAASSSGTTEDVLRDMRHVREENLRREKLGFPPILVVGFASDERGADEFRCLCTHGYFVGIPLGSKIQGESVVLSELGDLGEYAISELADALVVASAKSVGLNYWLRHENLGPTGAWHSRGAGIPLK